MMKFWRNLLILLGIFGFFSLASAVPASAQYVEKHRSSFEDKKFLKEFGAPSEIMSVINKTESGQIVCGNKDNLCNAASQICLRCSESHIETGLFWIDSLKDWEGAKKVTDSGRCVSKDFINNIQAAWPECTYKHEENGKILGNGSIIDERVLTLEKFGFLSKGEFGLFWEISKDSHTFTGADGKNYALAVNNKELVITYGENNSDDGGAFKGCEVFPVKAYKMQGCFYCNIAKIVFDAADSMTSLAFSSFAHSFKVILVVILAIWLTLMSANYAFSMTKQDAPKFLTSVLIASFKVAIAFYLLTYSMDIFKFFVRPVLEAGLALGEHIQTLDIGGDIQQVNENFKEQIESGGSLGTTPSRYYGDNLRTKIQNYLILIQSKLAYMQALGSTIFCVGSHRLTFWNILKGLIKDGLEHWVVVVDALRVLFLGGFFTVFGFLLTLVFGFYFIDAILQLVIIGAMLPIMILAWPLPFGQTKYASKGFEMLINTFLIFFLTGFVVCVNLELLNQSMVSAQQIQGNEEVSQGVLQETTEGFQTIIDALYEQNWEKLNDATTLGTSGFLLLVFSAIFGFQFVGKASEIAGKLSSGVFQGRGGLAGRIGTMAYSTAKGFAGRLASPFAEGITDQYHEAGGLTGVAASIATGLSKPTDWVGGKLTEKIGGAENKDKKWSEKSVQGKVGAVVGGVFKAPGTVSRFIKAGSRKIHGNFRHK